MGVKIGSNRSVDFDNSVKSSPKNDKSNSSNNESTKIDFHSHDRPSSKTAYAERTGIDTASTRHYILSKLPQSSSQNDSSKSSSSTAAATTSTVSYAASSQTTTPNLKPGEKERIQRAAQEVYSTSRTSGLDEASRRLAFNLNFPNQSADYKAALMAEVNNKYGPKFTAELLAHAFGKDGQPVNTDKLSLKDRGQIIDAYTAATNKGFISTENNMKTMQELVGIAKNYPNAPCLNIPPSPPTIGPADPVLSSMMAASGVQSAAANYNSASEKVAQLEARLQSELTALEQMGKVPPELKQRYIEAFRANPENQAIYKAEAAAAKELGFQLRNLQQALEKTPLGSPQDNQNLAVLLAGYKALTNSPQGAAQAADFVKNLHMQPSNVQGPPTALDQKLQLAQRMGAIPGYQSKILNEIYGPALEQVAMNELVASGGDPATVKQKLQPYLGVLQKFANLQVGNVQSPVNSVSDLVADLGVLSRQNQDFDAIKQYFPQLPGIAKAISVINVGLTAAAAARSGDQERVELIISALKDSPEAASIGLEALGKLAGSASLMRTVEGLSKIAPTVALLGDTVAFVMDANSLAQDPSNSNKIRVLGGAFVVAGGAGLALEALGVVSLGPAAPIVGAGLILGHTLQIVADVMQSQEEQDKLRAEVKAKAESLGYSLQEVAPKENNPTLPPPTGVYNDTVTIDFKSYEWVMN